MQITTLPCDVVESLIPAVVPRDRASLRAFHNERVLTVIGTGDGLRVIFDRCMGAESGAGVRMVTLARLAGVHQVFEVEQEIFLPAPRPITSRKGSMTYK